MSLQDIGYVQNIIAAVIAASAALAYNIFKHRHDRHLFKRELFVEFNSRYEKNYDKLDELLAWEIEIDMDFKLNNTTPDLDTVIEEGLSDPYGVSQRKFNIVRMYLAQCAEQYYWYKKGFVEENVWLTWKRAMSEWHDYLLSFRKVVELEKGREASYYEKDFLNLFVETKK